MAAPVREHARSLRILGHAAVPLLLLLLGALPARVAAQGPAAAPIVFVGTVVDSAGAPPPALSTLQLVVPALQGSGARPRYCAIGATDANGNFQLTLLALATGCSGAGNPLQLLVNGIPAMQTLSIPPAGGTYQAFFTLAVPLGGQPLGSSGQASNPAGAQVAGAGTIQLPEGCTQVVLSLGAGATAAQAGAELADPTALVAIWRYDNTAKRFTGYFADPAAPDDLSSLSPVDAVFICVSTPTSITSA